MMWQLVKYNPMAIITNSTNLAQSFRKWKAMSAEEKRKEQRISELMRPYLNNDESESAARAKAEADYLKIKTHETDTTT